MKENDYLRYLQVGLPKDIADLKNAGFFEEAETLIEKRLAEDIPDEMKYCMLAEREIMRRTPEEFPFTKEEAIAFVKERVPDFTKEEFEEFEKERLLHFVFLNGEKHYHKRFFNTLRKTEPAFGARAGFVTPNYNPLLDGVIEKVKKEGSVSERIAVTYSLKIKDELFEKGKMALVHIPIPAACEQQSEIHIEEIYPPSGMVDPEDAAARTVTWQEIMQENHEFYVKYSYVSTTKYRDIYDGSGVESSPTFFLEEEAPHIVFTPFIKALAKKLSSGCADPLEKARNFYDYITKEMRYTFMPPYFLLHDIADTCAKTGRGDCGVFALTFITLCRCVGIPACWQSGLTAEPDELGEHDWCRFYVEPYGWILCDPSYGGGAVRAGNEERRKFYFGNLDPYRMVANRAFQAEFLFPGEKWRQDPYDNQTGEIEFGHVGLQEKEIEHKEEVSVMTLD